MGFAVSDDQQLERTQFELYMCSSYQEVVTYGKCTFIHLFVHMCTFTYMNMYITYVNTGVHRHTYIMFKQRGKCVQCYTIFCRKNYVETVRSPIHVQFICLVNCIKWAEGLYYCRLVQSILLQKVYFFCKPSLPIINTCTYYIELHLLIVVINRFLIHEV